MASVGHLDADLNETAVMYGPNSSCASTAKSVLSTGSLLPDSDLVNFSIGRLIIASTLRPLSEILETCSEHSSQCLVEQVSTRRRLVLYRSPKC